jgi:hypothetical protein
MKLHDGSVSFNNSWLFIQFNCCIMSLENMIFLAEDLRNEGIIDIDVDFSDIDVSQIYFKDNVYSSTHNKLIRMQIEISDNHYTELSEKYPQFLIHN